jgi:hypothetical protein
MQRSSHRKVPGSVLIRGAISALILLFMLGCPRPLIKANFIYKGRERSNITIGLPQKATLNLSATIQQIDSHTISFTLNPKIRWREEVRSLILYPENISVLFNGALILWKCPKCDSLYFKRENRSRTLLIDYWIIMSDETKMAMANSTEKMRIFLENFIFIDSAPVALDSVIVKIPRLDLF